MLQRMVVVVGRLMVAIVSRAVHGVYIKCSTLPLPGTEWGTTGSVGTAGWWDSVTSTVLWNDWNGVWLSTTEVNIGTEDWFRTNDWTEDWFGTTELKTELERLNWRLNWNDWTQDWFGTTELKTNFERLKWRLILNDWAEGDFKRLKSGFEWLNSRLVLKDWTEDWLRTTELKTELGMFKSNVALRPWKPYGLLGTANPKLPPRLSHSSWVLS